MTLTLKTEILSPLGVRITGVDLAAASPETLEDLARRLRPMLAEHGVAILPGQQIDDEDFLAFLRSLGELTFTTGEAALEGYPDLNLISNVGREVAPVSNFHVDTSYLAHPPAYTALRAVAIPEEGGATQFTDQVAAAATLPADLREQVRGRTIRHVVTGVDGLGPDDETQAEHPVLRPHPVTGRPVLYLTSPKRCASVSGLDEQASAELVAALLAHSTRPQNMLAHAWSPGDVVVWDNACVLHRADHAGVVGDRVMHRGMVASHAG